MNAETLQAESEGKRSPWDPHTVTAMHSDTQRGRAACLPCAHLFPADFRESVLKLDNVDLVKKRPNL